MAERLNHPLFAHSREVRKFCNEPHKLLRARLHQYEPPPMSEVVEEIFKKNGVLKAQDDHLKHSQRKNAVLKAQNDEATSCPGHETYSQVQEHAKSLKLHYDFLTPDMLQALRMHSLEAPKFYEFASDAFYGFENGQASLGEWDDYGCHLDLAISRLAEHKPRKGRLFRVAWIPEKVWKNHFENRGPKDDVRYEVVFYAPMSAAEETQWSFYKENPAKRGYIPVLIEFDERASRKAACLSTAQHPISSFGTREKEWTFGPFFRGSIESIGKAAVPGDGASANREIDKVVIGQLHTLEALPELLKPRPTEEILNGALILGLLSGGSGEGESRDQQVKRSNSTLDQLQAISTLAVSATPMRDTAIEAGSLAAFIFGLGGAGAAGIGGAGAGSFAAAFGAVVPVALLGGAIALNATIFSLRMLGSEGFDRKSRIRFANDLIENTIANLSKLGQKSEHFQCLLERANDDLKTSLEGGRHWLHDYKERLVEAYRSPEQEQDELNKLARNQEAAGKQSEDLAHLMLRNRILGALIDAEETVIKKVLDQAAFRSGWKPVESILRVGDDLWDDRYLASADNLKDEPKGDLVRAKVDVLRLMTAATRILTVFGAPDAGKTTFLETVYGFEDLGPGAEESGRTSVASLHRHPRQRLLLRRHVLRGWMAWLPRSDPSL